MEHLAQVNLQNHLPPSIAGDKNVQQLAAVFTTKIKELYNAEAKVLLLDLDNQPENIIDHLAGQYHVDTYDSSMSLAVKRLLVKSSISWHKQLGTVAAVKKAAKDIYGNIKVVEHYGSPFYFKLEIDNADIKNGEMMNAMIDAVLKSKNVRSWLEGVYSTQSISDALNVAAISSIKSMNELKLSGDLVASSPAYLVTDTVWVVGDTPTQMVQAS